MQALVTEDPGTPQVPLQVSWEIVEAVGGPGRGLVDTWYLQHDTNISSYTLAPLESVLPDYYQDPQASIERPGEYLVPVASCLTTTRTHR